VLHARARESRRRNDGSSEMRKGKRNGEGDRRKEMEVKRGGYFALFVREG
jgi:hypothetical protein